ncbi:MULTISPECIES: tol-pal system protein YbgF [Legionella]|uniref:Cell division coordinator CpoB n=1 Tax=Legionella resiliens TaxID=2905958 RepID=A0ABS8XBH8_9GAMM|nr:MULTISPECIES: tol-pal system protein YbgF [unclassified Legionella]MCE0724322.1 tol-pal system protein YbgF [Legionella sp. 9fVS26]MCE3533474.1 tol-pal system protein YbgF [Legionella sp. 8cVS16]QLZ69659.1 tol-pal system protein YbgF [Legionella sp. PC1000]
MINCKKHIIATGFILMLPLASWAEAPVVDDSDNFAIIEGQQAYETPAYGPKYDEPQIESGQFDVARNENYTIDNSQTDDEPALAKDDQATSLSTNITNNAKLIDKIQSLQQEIQELRGQLEVQAHDLKLLQQQQVAFYKDLDARLSGSSSAKSSSKPALDLSAGSKETTPKATGSASNVQAAKSAVPTPTPVPVTTTSRVNPADEQISYLAAYESVKNKRYDDAINAMNVFVQKYPRGGYTANAQYWLGELYLVKKDYPKSIEHFTVVLQQFPTSSKSAASMLKIGYAYAAQGDTQEAKKFLQQVVRAYPGTPTAQLANSKLHTI